MCDLCRMIPCHPRCPNAPELVPVHKCCKCGEGIFEGDKYLETLDGNVCKDCLDDMDTEDVLMLLGEIFATA